MPAMLVAKLVLADHIKKEKLKDLEPPNNDSSNSSILNDSNTELKKVSNDKESDTSCSIDEQLSKQLNWLTYKLRSMHTSNIEFDQSGKSLNNSYSNCIPTTNKSLNTTPHQFAMSTWLIRTDPRLAYEVYKSSVVDGHYGACVEFIKR